MHILQKVAIIRARELVFIKFFLSKRIILVKQFQELLVQHDFAFNLVDGS